MFRRPVVRVLCALVAAFGLGSVDAVAQEPGRLSVDGGLESIRRRIEFISPLTGPPGTVVALRTGGLPAITPLRIGVGAIRFGFEEVAQVASNIRGEIDLKVEIPPWAKNDQTLILIVFDFYFAPIALSEPFHLTGPDGTVLRRGQLAEEGLKCPALRGEDGELYTLRGSLLDFAVGDTVAIEGRVVDAPMCPETTIEIVRIRSAPPES